MRKADTGFYFKLSSDELSEIRKRMKKAGIKNMSAYIRKMALNGYIVVLDLSDVKEVLRLLHINSNNLNQYAKKANAFGIIYQADIDLLKTQQKEILEEVKKISNRLLEMR